MKRRQFFKLTGQAAVCLAVGVPAVVAVAKRLSVEEQIRKILAEDMKRTLDDLVFNQFHDGNYVSFVHPSQFQASKLLTDNGDSYEGIRFIEQTHLSL